MRTVTLGDVAEWGSGGTPARGVPSYFGQGMPWLSITDLNDGVVTNAKESLTAAGLANSSAKVVPRGTIFVAMYGSIGKLGIAATDMATSQAIAFARPNEKLVDRRFLFQYLLAERRNLQSRGRGGTQMNISQADLKAWPMPLPPLPEQRRIAAILDLADALRGKRRQVLAHLDALTQSTFHDMFGSLEWLDEFGSIIVSGPTNGLYRPSSDYGTGAPILRIDGFTSGATLSGCERWKRLRVDESELRRFALAPGDIVINRVNALSHLGKSALVTALTEPSVFESNMMRVQVDTDRARPEFVLAWLQTERARQQILRKAKKAINQASINQTDVRSLLLPLPPIELQRNFSTRVDRVLAQRGVAEQALAADDELFASLQARAFDGRL